MYIQIIDESRETFYNLNPYAPDIMYFNINKKMTLYLNNLRKKNSF